MGCLKIGTSTQGRNMTFDDYFESIELGEKPIAFVIGGVSVGNPCMGLDYIEDCLCISNYPLSAACVCSKLCFALEKRWGVF